MLSKEQEVGKRTTGSRLSKPLPLQPLGIWSKFLILTNPLTARETSQSVSVVTMQTRGSEFNAHAHKTKNNKARQKCQLAAVIPALLQQDRRQRWENDLEVLSPASLECYTV